MEIREISAMVLMGRPEVNRPSGKCQLSDFRVEACDFLQSYVFPLRKVGRIIGQFSVLSITLRYRQNHFILLKVHGLFPACPSDNFNI